jgi:hypothetical protein
MDQFKSEQSVSKKINDVSRSGASKIIIFSKKLMILFFSIHLLQGEVLRLRFVFLDTDLIVFVPVGLCISMICMIYSIISLRKIFNQRNRNDICQKKNALFIVNSFP